MIYLGYISLSSAVGFFLGASNTPVVGAFITALIGLVGTVVSAQYFFDKALDTMAKVKHLSIGITLISLCLVSSALIGEYYRNVLTDTEKPLFPWDGLETPVDTYEALDWIATSEKMKKFGYTHKDVQTVYKIRIQERKLLMRQVDQEMQEGVENYSLTVIYDSTEPYNQILFNDFNKKSITRGLASP